MPLTMGSRLGPYEILSAIGAGGMGEVYRARDTKLGREVAIKVLPEAFARDAARMARFSREAKLLAALNHTNIAAIHGLEDSGDTHALVMELAEGPTLADRISGAAPMPISPASAESTAAATRSGQRRPLPLDDVLKIAKQMADALEYAHEKGIIHRDLKPANVKVAADDTVKILDFGLAKAMETELTAEDIANSPTVSRLATQAGVLLGTAAYMSPEQAKAKPVDRRADIWAFGCVLYEMLTGKGAFHGDTVTDTLAAVIRAEPDWSQLPAATPMRVRVLLQRCLQKDAKQRLRDMGDARISLDEVLTGAPEAAPSLAVSAHPATRRWLWPVVALAGVVAGVVLGGVTIWNLKPSPPKPVMRFTITLPPGQHLAGLDRPALALSSDGSELAYVATTQGVGVQQIYLREMDSAETRAIPGTEGARGPFFSPDGQWLGFFAGGKLKKISVSGGAAVTLADAGFPLGASWGSQGMIVFVPNLGPLQKVSDAGGAPQPLAGPERGVFLKAWPEFLPGSKAVVFSRTGGGIAAQRIGTGDQRNLIEGVYSPGYASSGHLVYVQGASLMVVPFDPERLVVKGAAVPVVQGVLSSGLVPAAQYSLSATGSLAYVSGSAQALQSQLVWVSRNGAVQSLAAPARTYGYPRLSPDGSRVAVVSETQVWLYDLARDTLSRFTFEGTGNNLPVWTPDGKRIAFMSNKDGPPNIFWQLADGSGGLERLTSSENSNAPLSFSPDGQLLAFQENNPSGGIDISVLRLSDRKARPFLQTTAVKGAPQFSPDGHWLVYVSEESGRFEIYVQPYPGSGGKWQISTDGGTEPVWNRNGRELFYRSDDKVMAVAITTHPSFSAGKPKELFEGPYLRIGGTFPQYDVSPDGQRFLMLKPADEAQAVPTQINVVLNWTEELKRLVPTGNK